MNLLTIGFKRCPRTPQGMGKGEKRCDRKERRSPKSSRPQRKKRVPVQKHTLLNERRGEEEDSTDNCRGSPITSEPRLSTKNCGVGNMPQVIKLKKGKKSEHSILEGGDQSIGIRTLAEASVKHKQYIIKGRRLRERKLPVVSGGAW